MIPRTLVASAWTFRAWWLAALVASPVAGGTASAAVEDVAVVNPEATRQAMRPPDPLAGTPRVSPNVTGTDPEPILARLAKPRSDAPADWTAPVEPLHYVGEPRALPSCVPPPPCHPSIPPRPFDLVGEPGTPSCGPIYRGPCEPRAPSSDDGPLSIPHRLYDRFFDCFYKWK